MKTTISKLIIGLAALTLVNGAFAQTPMQHGGMKPAAPMQGMGMMKMGMGMDMKKCMADMKAGAAKLDDLAAMMNACKGQDKINATAAVVNEMLAQKKKMDAMCMQMMSHMSGMMDHMGGGMMGHMGAAAAKPATPPVDHSKHHGG